MAQFWQRQKIYAQVTALGAVGGRWGPLAKSSRSTSITPDSPAKLRQTIPRFTTLEGHESARARGKSIGGATVTGSTNSTSRGPCRSQDPGPRPLPRPDPSGPAAETPSSVDPTRTAPSQRRDA